MKPEQRDLEAAREVAGNLFATSAGAEYSAKDVERIARAIATARAEGFNASVDEAADEIEGGFYSSEHIAACVRELKRTV